MDGTIPFAKEAVWFIVLFIVLAHGYLLGRFGIFLFLAIQSIIQTTWYYLAPTLGWQSDVGSLILAIAVTHGINFFLKPSAVEKQLTTTHDTHRPITKSILLLVMALGTSAFVLRGALHASTTESIRTPWPLLPEGTLLAIAVGWLLFFASSIVVRSSFFATLHGMIVVFTTTAIAPILYRLGFGFDGFLHIASEKILLATGTLSPKPFYYIGQYVFTTWLARMTDIPIDTIDRWLVPVSAALLLPLALSLALPKDQKKTLGYSVLGLLPLSGFVATTPQGFSYVLSLSALILAYGSTKKTVHPITALILSAWAIATHPLAGIPIFFVCLAIIIRSRIFSGVLIALSAIAVPLLFVLLSMRGGTPIAWNPSTVLNPAPWIARAAEFLPWIGNRFVLWPAWATLSEKILPLFLILAALASFKQRTTKIFLFSAIALWISATALKTTGNFTFLIDYERGNYADRLNMLALFCLIPAAIPGLMNFWDRASHAPRFIRLALLCFAAAGATAITYNSLPRHDALVTGRGWSTSAADIEAVKLVDRDAGGRLYTVLSNQSVSAAAVKTFGFKRYAGDVFYYPIPTGGPLYETYLKMVYDDPSWDTVADAARLGKTDLVYVVLNDYWWRAETVSEALREIANETTEMRDGKAWVYKFDLSTRSSSATTTSGL